MILDQTHIQKALEEYVSPEEAEIRARWITEDMHKIGFELLLSTENPPGLWKHLGVVQQTEYILPKSGFDINSPDDNSALSGSFVTCGNLLRLSQCVKLGRLYLPKIWPDSFGITLKNAEHLSALNEVWWLKFWRRIQSVERGPKANRAAPDFEWILHLHDGLSECQINLEVKRRPGNINQYFKRGSPSCSTEAIAKKFGQTPDNVANVVAITVFYPPSRNALRQASDWLQRHPNVHGLLIWTEGNLGVTPMLKCFKQERQWAEFMLEEPETEDLKVCGKTAGTLCTAAEAPEFILRMVEAKKYPTIHHL
jgi:hypothetical protein